MDRRTLTEILSRKLGMEKEETGALIDSLRNMIAVGARDMDSVSLPGFGTFEPKKRLERITTHPASGKRILIPPKIVMTFKPSAVLKQKVNSQNR